MIKLFAGVPGAGKSLAMQDTVRMLTRESKLGCCIIDRTNEWGIHDKDGNVNIRWRNDPPDDLRILTPNDDNGEIYDALMLAREEGKAVVFQFFDAPTVGKWVRDVGDLVYVDDEIDLTARFKDWLNNPLRAFVHTGRHLPDAEGYPREVHILGACRRVQNIHTDVTEMADEVFIFRSQGKNTLKRILDEGWAYDEDIEFIRTQPNLSFLKWNSDGQTMRGHILPLK